MPQKKPTMRSQRMRSLADMSKLQNDAATTIQREYRFYRRRQTNRNRRNHRLAMQAQTFLDVFLLREVTSLVPVCLLEVLRETRAQEAASVKLKKDFAASLADDVLVSLIDESIRDIFHDVLQATVKSYLSQQLDFYKAATPTPVAVATDILDNWVQELVANLLPEVLVELASEYTVRQQHDVLWETLLRDEHQSVASDAVVIVKADSAKPRLASLTKDEDTITTCTGQFS
ncbi:hypothetical protein V7S43_002062 [Phytophthora oleae]|uniref:Uncharacterized protein n=1 Tax=Phytophthora oleae TaxID=2107226 RepID=A0ABD3G293_9STRA